MRSLGMAEKWFLLVSVILLIFALGITYVVTQKQEGLQEVQIKKAEVQGELERLKMLLAQDVLTPDLEAMSRAVPRDWQLPHVLADITLALERHQLTLHSLKVYEGLCGRSLGGKGRATGMALLPKTGQQRESLWIPLRP